MKAILLILATVSAACFAYGSEPLASVESQDLGPIPQVIRSTIESDISFRPYGSLNCKVQGKKFHCHRIVWYLHGLSQLVRLVDGERR
ncbi:hypothetical protein OKW42_006104 [Paraburkholderia sp. WC7.3d]